VDEHGAICLRIASLAIARLCVLFFFSYLSQEGRGILAPQQLAIPPLPHRERIPDETDIGMRCGHEGESSTCSGMSLAYGCLCFASLEGRETFRSWLAGGTHNCTSSWMDER